MANVESLFMSLPTLHVHALAAGPKEGPLVMLLHGFPEFSESWSEVLPLLAERGFRAVAPDLRGYGKTDKPKHGYDVHTLARDVAAMIELLSKRGRAHVVGHDWGGVVAYHLAAYEPERVEHLAVVNAPHPEVMTLRLWNPEQLLRSWYMLFFQLPLLPERVLTLREARLIPRMIAGSMKDRRRFPPERAEKYAQNFMQPGVASAALAYYRENLRGRLRPSRLRGIFERYPKIRAPFRLVWGEADAALGNALTVDLDPWFEHPPRVDYLPGVGHFAPIEAPEQVAKSLLEHLASPTP